MVSNRKKDKTVKICAAISAVLCVACIVLGGVAAWHGTGYSTEGSTSVSVSSYAELVDVCKSGYNDTIYLESDITISEKEFRLGSDELPFKGVFDGQGHTVRFVLPNVTSEVSMFHYLAEGAVVRNVQFDFGDVRVSDASFGGIAKINDGTIENCKLTYKSITISDTGMFSPLVTINRGTISNVVVSGNVYGEVSPERESRIFFGNVCAYNSGILKGAIVTANYSELASTRELDILKGTVKNNGISAVRCRDIDAGRTEGAVAVLGDGQFTSDKGSNVVFTTADQVYTEENIFSALDFSNKYWKIDGQNLSLIRGVKQ